MIKFIHNQGHIKIIIINEPQYNPSWSMLCPSISVPSITIFIYIIYQNDFLCLTACMWPVHFHVTGVASRPMGRHENILDICRSRSYQIKLKHKYTETHHQPLLGIFTILFFDSKEAHITRFVSIHISLAITTYHWFITHNHNTYCQSDYLA